MSMVRRPRPVVIIKRVEGGARDIRPARLAGCFADAPGRERGDRVGQELAGPSPIAPGHAAGATAPGNVNQIVVPTPTSEVGQICPPWR